MKIFFQSVLLLLVFASCDNGILGKRDSAQLVAKKFVSYMKHHDIEGAKACCTAQSAKMLDRIFKIGGQAFLEEISDNPDMRDSIVGDKAFVFFKNPPKPIYQTPIHLVKLDGQWKVDLLSK
ncbi:MAG: hypothetical protein JNL70_07085 [Saprospiraceae bacterium]|nr:hypothetical protein [Saprospiraceae bacterium]